MHRPTREDVAREAGVSKTTVTYVLTNRSDVTIPESTRERVRHAASALGYRPHAAAQALASGRTKTLAIAFPIRIGAHYAHVLQSVERLANANGYHLMATTIGHADIQNVEPDLNDLLTSLTDGIILVDVPGAFQPQIQSMLPAAKPIISIGVFTVEGTDRVVVDLEQAAVDAMAHLLASHAKRISFFGPGQHDEEELLETFAQQGQLDPRYSAYCRAMHEADLPLELIAGSPGSRRVSMTVLKEHILSEGCPEAIFCMNDEMAVAANRALRELGYNVPNDVLIVGCDGSVEGEYMSPALSTIVQPIDTMCMEAWRLMEARLSSPDAPTRVVNVAAQLVIRCSSVRE